MLYSICEATLTHKMLRIAAVVFCCAAPSSLSQGAFVKGLSLSRMSVDGLSDKDRAGLTSTAEKVTLRYYAPYRGDAGGHYEYLQKKIACLGDEDANKRFLLFTDASVRSRANVGTFAQLGVVAYSSRGLAKARRDTAERKAEDQRVGSIYDRVPDVLAAGIGGTYFKRAQELLNKSNTGGTFGLMSDSWKDNALTAVAEGEALWRGLNLAYGQQRLMLTESSSGTTTEGVGDASAHDGAKLLAFTDSLHLIRVLEWIFHGGAAAGDVLSDSSPGAGFVRHMQETVAKPIADLFSQVGLKDAFQRTLEKLTRSKVARPGTGSMAKSQFAYYQHVEILHVRSSSRVIRKEEEATSSGGSSCESASPVEQELEKVPSEATTSPKAYTFGNALADQLASGFTLMHSTGTANLLSKRFCENPGGWLKRRRTSTSTAAEKTKSSSIAETNLHDTLYSNCKELMQDLSNRMPHIPKHGKQCQSATFELEQDVVKRFRKFAVLYQKLDYAALEMTQAVVGASAAAVRTSGRGRRPRSGSRSGGRRRGSRRASSTTSSRSSSRGRSSSPAAQEEEAVHRGGEVVLQTGDSTDDTGTGTNIDADAEKQKALLISPLDWFRSQAQVALQHCGSPPGLGFASGKLMRYLDHAWSEETTTPGKAGSSTAGSFCVGSCSTPAAPADAIEFDVRNYEEHCGSAFSDYFGRMKTSSVEDTTTHDNPTPFQQVPLAGKELMGRLWARIAVMRRVRSSLIQSETVLRDFVASINTPVAQTQEDAGEPSRSSGVAGPTSKKEQKSGKKKQKGGPPATAAAVVGHKEIGTKQPPARKGASASDEASYHSVVAGTVKASKVVSYHSVVDATVKAAKVVLYQMEQWSPIALQGDVRTQNLMLERNRWLAPDAQVPNGDGAKFVRCGRLMKEPMEVLDHLLSTFTKSLYAKNAGIRLATRGNYRATAQRVLDVLSKAAIPLATAGLESLLASLEDWLETVIMPLSSKENNLQGNDELDEHADSSKLLRTEVELMSQNFTGPPIEWRANAFERRLAEMQVVAAAVEKEKQTLLYMNLHKVPERYDFEKKKTAVRLLMTDAFDQDAAYVKELQKARDVYVPAHDLILGIDLQFAGIDLPFGTANVAEPLRSKPSRLARPPPVLSLVDLPISLMQQLALDPPSFTAEVGVRLRSGRGVGDDSSATSLRSSQEDADEDAVLYQSRFGLGRLRMTDDKDGNQQNFLNKLENESDGVGKYLWAASPWARSNWISRGHEEDGVRTGAELAGSVSAVALNFADVSTDEADALKKIFRSSGPSVHSVIAEAVGRELPIRLSGIVGHETQKAAKVVLRDAEQVSREVSDLAQMAKAILGQEPQGLGALAIQTEKNRVDSLLVWLQLKIARHEGALGRVQLRQATNRGAISRLWSCRGEDLEEKEKCFQELRKEIFRVLEVDGRAALTENFGRINMLMPQEVSYGADPQVVAALSEEERTIVAALRKGGLVLSFRNGTVERNDYFEEVLPFETPSGGEFVEYHPILRLPVAYTKVVDFESPLENPARETRTVVILFFDEKAAKFAVLPLPQAAATPGSFGRPHGRIVLPRAPLASYDKGMRWALDESRMEQLELVSPKFLHGSSVRGIVD
ncbi:unnamed protein product [Amoebophrya sp. A120]|nr:unnamed protein product [Amoebophrya sp. A120]|eukprot:GSA120T00021335001.1